MSEYYLDEYLQAAHAQGYRDYGDGVTFPPNTMPSKEKEYWHLGYRKAMDEDDNGYS